MKKLFFFLTIIIFVSCSQQGDRTEAIKEEIKQHKAKITELETKIADLEKELPVNINTDEHYAILVNTDTAEYQVFRHFFEARGSIESINEAFISPEINGQIIKIYVKEGEAVKKNQMLVKLNTTILENNITEIKTSLELATTVYEKQKQLWDKKIGSELQFLEAKNNKESMETRLKTLESQLDMAYIRSPINGIVDEIFFKEGELAVPGKQLMQIVDLQDLYINADIAENYLPSIKKGDIVWVTFPSYPDFTIETPVYRTGNVINPKNRTFNVQLKIDNEDDKLKPNIMSIIKINDYTSDNALLIPSIVMKQDMIGTYVYKAVAKDDRLVAQKIYIEPGISYKDKTQVLKGLDPGDVVIINGFNLVSDGTAIKLK